MFYRDKLNDLHQWAKKKDRKPLIIRGARQVGKTTLVEMFSKSFDNYLYFNLDTKEDKEVFEDIENIDKLVEALFLLRKKVRVGKRNLIFIDEVQNSPNAVKMLRYFYEKYNDLYIVAAGSLLEVSVDYKVSFPVGRVEFLYLYPFSFTEYLYAIGENQIIEMLDKIPFPEYAHKKVLEYFYDYAFIGGMPEIIKTFVKSKDLNLLGNVYESLLVSYLDDVEKYAKSSNKVNVLRHVIRTSFYSTGKRIKFNGFGNSNYRSREIGEALRTLERAMLLKLIYPSSTVKVPIIPDKRKAPKLLLLDIGLVNYFAGLKKTFLGIADLSDVYNGSIAEQIVGQELNVIKDSDLVPLSFWVREKSQSSAEIDYLFNFDNKVIPIEVKSGTAGKLKSLNLFMDMSHHSIAVRIYSGKLMINSARTQTGKEFTLLSLPFYLTNKIESYLNKLKENGYKTLK